VWMCLVRDDTWGNTIRIGRSSQGNEMKSKAKNPSRKIRSRKKRNTDKSLLEELAHPSFQIDRKLIRKNVKLSANLGKVLAAASPRSTEYLRSGIAVDLADFWEIGEEHRRRIKELSAMRFPKDKQRFIDMLYEFEVRLVIHAEYHAKLLKRRLVRLKRDLELE
jgi:hypothetical protein